MLCNRCGHARKYHQWTGSHYTACVVEACPCNQFVLPGDADIYDDPRNAPLRSIEGVNQPPGPQTPPPRTRKRVIMNGPNPVEIDDTSGVLLHAPNHPPSPSSYPALKSHCDESTTTDRPQENRPRDIYEPIPGSYQEGKPAPQTEDQPHNPLIPGSYQKGRPSPDDTFYSIPWKDLNQHLVDNPPYDTVIPGIGISLPEKPDAVNPSYYDGDTCMRAIEQATKYDSGAIAFLRGQIIKYAWRLGRKDNPEVDAGKLKWYLDRLVSLFKAGARELKLKDEEDAHRKSTSEARQRSAAPGVDR